MKIKNKEIDFGKNLRLIRQDKGLTQLELGKLAGISQRMIFHYENHSECPPIKKILKLSDVLNVSVDELLGQNKNVKLEPPKHPKLWAKLKQFEKLSRTEKRVIIKMLDSFLEKKTATK